MREHKPYRVRCGSLGRPGHIDRGNINSSIADLAIEKDKHELSLGRCPGPTRTHLGFKRELYVTLKKPTPTISLQTCQLVLPLVAVVRIYIQIGSLVVAQDIVKIADMTKRAMLVKLVGPFLQFVTNIDDIMM